MTFSPGDRVAYSAKWLKSMGQFSGPLPALRGTVTSVEPFGGRALIGVAWDGPAKVLDCNLTLVSRIAIDAALA